MTGNKTALLVIDVQRELFSKGIPIYKADDLLRNINTLVARAHAAGAPVVYVQHASKSHLLEDSDGWQLHPGLQPVAGDIMVRKTHPSSFEDTSLAQELAKNDVGALLISGLVTHGCVKATSLAALELGYKTTIVADAHSSYSKDAASLVEEWNQKLAEAGARVAATNDVRFK
jgi:nicotinamidase-related amidase